MESPEATKTSEQLQGEWIVAGAADLLVDALERTYPDDISFAPFRDGATGTNNFIPKPPVDDPIQRQELDEVWEKRRRELLERFQKEKKPDQTFDEWAIANSGLGGEPDLNNGRKVLNRIIAPNGDYSRVRTDQMKAYLAGGVARL